MHNVTLVQEGDAREQHVEVGLDLWRCEWPTAVPNHLPEVTQHQFEGQHEASTLSEHVKQSHYLNE